MSKISKKPIFMLVDGHALMHKGYHAIPFLSTSKGQPTNAVYGFTSIFLNAIKNLQPEQVAVTFDLPKKTFRHQEYEEYKAHRKPTPDDLTLQIPVVKEVVRALNIPVFEKGGYEADDLIGTIAKKLEQDHPDLEVVIVTGDLDTLQLVTEKVKVYTMKKGLTDAFVYGPKEVEDRYGLKPSQMVDYRALRGDASDNIPGVAGVGEKTGTKLIAQFGSLDKLYEKIEANQTDDLKPRIKNLLIEQKEQALLSRRLSQIDTNVALDFKLEDCRLSDYDLARVVELFKELEFKSLIPKLPQPEKSFSENKASSSYRLINTEDELKKILPEIKKSGSLTVDTETDGLNPFECQLLGVALSWQQEQAVYVNTVENRSFLELLKPILSDPKIEKYGHNLKYDYQVLQNHGVALQPLTFDTMLASYLINPGSRQHDLDTVVFNEFGHQMIPIEQLIGKGRNKKTLKEVSLDELVEYACEDADYTMRLVEKMRQVLYEQKTLHLLEEIEMPLVSVLAGMEKKGISLNLEHLKNLSEKLHQELSEIESEIFKTCGEEFNVNSPSQLAKILFEKLEIDTSDIKRTKTGYSTAASELQKLEGQHSIIDLVTKYRELQKLLSTYIDALPDLVSEKDGRVHTSYNQAVTSTGRLSSSDPNLQNIPIRTALGNEIRKAFVAEEGSMLLALDYSQIELRIAASLAQDEAMLEVFKKDGDIHRATASRIFNVPLDKVTSSQRRDAKTINFSVLYGVSAFGLSQRSEMSRHEAKEFIAKYFEAFPGIAKYIEETIAGTREKRYIENPLGRKRHLPEIISSNFQVRSAAERAAVNMPFQSLNADIIKMAMIKIHQQIKDQDDIAMLLQVHDELVFEVKKGKEQLFAKDLQKIMEQVYNLAAGLKVEAKCGRSWGELETL